MTTQDLEKTRELAQEKKETRYLMAETESDLRAARSDAKGFGVDVSNGVPGARVELAEAQKRVAELEERAKGLETRFLSISQQSAALVGWDTQARSLAQEHGLDETQMEQLFELFKAGKSRETVQREAQRLALQAETAEKKGRRYAFQENSVAW